MVAASHENSSAIGAGAQTVFANQMMFGTADQSYTMPGITSDLSRQRQLGRLQLATTDAYGNLASDGGDVFKAIGTVQAGVAVAMAVETPGLTTEDNFGMRVGWGGFDGSENAAHAIGASAIGVVARDIFRKGTRLALDGGIGWGWSEFKSYSASDVIAGRGGVQFTW
jgi:trimeric autotransporter adhesin